MAEAVVGERTSAQTRFYCHMCNLEINIFNNDYTCPLCSGGFIEELPPLAVGGSDGSNSTSGSANVSRSSSLIDAESDLPATDLPTNRINDLVTTLLMGRSFGNIGPPGLEISIDAGGGGGGVSGVGGGSGGAGSGGGSSGTGESTYSSGSRGNSVNRRGASGSGGSGSGSGSSGGGGRQRQTNFHRLDNVFLEFLSSLRTVEDAALPELPMFFMGNPGDYAWGREGIDTVVTQLLNHMDTSGPPPLPKEKIAEIPTVKITETEVDQKLKCSVCWEDFKLQEAVRKLPCLHVYHENCIVPWLDLHGTCPICRKSLQIEPSTSCSIHNGAASTSGESSNSSATAAASRSSLSSSTATTNASTANASSNNINNQTQPMDTSSGTSATGTAPTAAVVPQQQGDQGTSQATGGTSQIRMLAAFDEDGNVEYGFD